MLISRASSSIFSVLCALSVGGERHLAAAIIGTNPPAQALNTERIAVLPASGQSTWKKYLARSARQLPADQAFLRAEMLKRQLNHPINPPAGSSAKSIPLKKPSAWYGETEGQRIADIIVSFQTPA